MIRRQERDILLLQPGNHRRIEAGVFAARRYAPQIGANFFPAGPHSGANEHSITGQYLQSGLFQPRLDILDVDRSARLEVFDAFELRDIDEDATSENPILEIVTPVF